MNQKILTTYQYQLTHVRRNILLGDRGQDFVNCRLADVYQHAGVREPPCCLNLDPLFLRDDTTQRLSTIVFPQHLPVRYRRHSLVIEFEPPAMPIRFDESEIMSAVEIAGVCDDTVKSILPGLRPVGSLIEETVKVNFEGEFEAIVDLRGGQNQTNNCPSAQVTRTLTTASHCTSYS